MMQSLFQIPHITYVYLFVGGIFFTYICLGGLIYWFAYICKPHLFSKIKIQKERPTQKSIIHDISWSFITMTIWSVVAYIIILLTNHGYTKVYFVSTGHDMFYNFCVVIFFFVLHDTYYYWIHRFMHSNDLVYTYAHKVHHTTSNPTSLSMFSFSPIEALLHGFYFTLICFIVPIHFYAVAAVFALNSFANIVGHLGYEFLSLKMNKKFEFLFIDTIHHNSHHKHGYLNYGIYFPFWDKMMGTLHHKYHDDKDQFYKEKYAK